MSAGWSRRRGPGSFSRRFGRFPRRGSRSSATGRSGGRSRISPRRLGLGGPGPFPRAAAAGRGAAAGCGGPGCSPRPASPPATATPRACRRSSAKPPRPAFPVVASTHSGIPRGRRRRRDRACSLLEGDVPGLASRHRRVARRRPALRGAHGVRPRAASPRTASRRRRQIARLEAHYDRAAGMRLAYPVLWPRLGRDASQEQSVKTAAALARQGVEVTLILPQGRRDPGARRAGASRLVRSRGRFRGPAGADPVGGPESGLVLPLAAPALPLARAPVRRPALFAGAGDDRRRARSAPSLSPPSNIASGPTNGPSSAATSAGPRATAAASATSSIRILRRRATAAPESPKRSCSSPITAPTK